MSSIAASWGRVAAVCAASLGALLLPAGPAAAHPFGPPPTAQLSASGRQVAVQWQAPPDDAMVIGMAIGVLDDGSLERYLEGPVQTAPPAAKEEELSASPQLRDYLLDRITVAQGERPCDGMVEPIDDFLRQGARVLFDCPEPVQVVQVRIAMLHDVHAAYRTFAHTAGDGRPLQSVFTAARAQQPWDFTASPAEPRRGSWGWPLGAALMAGAAAVGTIARRRGSGTG